MACCGKKTFIIRCSHAATAITIRVLAKNDEEALDRATSDPSGRGALEYKILRSF